MPFVNTGKHARTTGKRGTTKWFRGAVGSTIFLGILDWLLPFAVSLGVFPLRAADYFWFESLMSVVVTVSAVAMGVWYFRTRITPGRWEGLRVGGAWLLINLALDLLLFLPPGPMHMALAPYLTHIGTKYLSIPVIVGGLGHLLTKQ